MSAWRPWIGMLMLALVGGSAGAQEPPVGTVVRPAASPAGTVVVPDRFLRRWDAVTVFFDHDVVPSAGPEDRPERWVQVSPAHAGAYTWLDTRTLQFRPADPWPPLTRFRWRAGGRETMLATLMEAPRKLLPRPGSEDLSPVEAITLTFAEPLPPAALAQMVSIDLKPLPGVGGGATRRLTAEDFEIKVLERRTPADAASYVLRLRSPIPLGMRATVRLRLTPEDDPTRTFAEYGFSTAVPFRVVAIGGRKTRYPVADTGSRYGRDQALSADSGERVVVVELSAPPAEVDPVHGRNLVHFTPPVDGLTFRTAGKTVEVSGDFRWDTLYRVTLTGAALRDADGRPLETTGESEVYVYFPKRAPYLRWGASQGLVERRGPQDVPVEGRGFDRFDLRIYRVDPMDRSFWPFPDRPVAVDEAKRPPGPGEAPKPYGEPRPISARQLAAHLRSLGSPVVSALVDLPLREDRGAARLGLDLSQHLARIAGPGAPGHYLVGLRPLAAGAERQWLRLQVTDLSLTAVEEPGAVRFLVTSLRTGAPLAGASVRVEGVRNRQWVSFASGTTLGDGSYTWQAPGPNPRASERVLRITVAKDGDVLVLDPSHPPEGYADNRWSPSSKTWLQWALRSLVSRFPQPEYLAHVYTERPVYRPEDTVHIKGYVRERAAGKLGPFPLKKPSVVVGAPGDLEWRYPVTLTGAGSFYHAFHEEDLPTGVYSTHLEGTLPDGAEWASRDVSFRVEAYRIPQFEVNLDAPDRVPLDRDFRVSLTATYYAGGRVSGRPVAWRVTQFPYAWSPKGRAGFHFSSDSRYSRSRRFEATAAIQKSDETDADGGASLSIDPTIEPSAQPRTYVVEATVTGADDQTVTNTRRVVALPPFVLGLKVPRYLERATRLEPEILVLGLDDQPLAGQTVKVRLLHRQWHSHLKASDFSNGVARYATEVTDDPVQETTVVSGKESRRLSLPIPEAGVYVVELEAQDRLGRTQVVTVDLYAGGEQAVAWTKPVTRVFKVATDKDRYDPGETATFVLESPFQSAEALVIVETPEGNRYQWLPVRGGSASFKLQMERTWVPRLPVHFVLMRGRLEHTGPQPGSAMDLGKPATLASTAWVKVNPRDNRVQVELEYPERALPGRTVDVTIRLSDPDAKPLPGEVTLWLVDQAVLALGKEQPLDPLPDFLTQVHSHLLVHDTRGLVFGRIPYAEAPGGGGEAEPAPPLERATVRRTFKPVPYYEPRILVGEDGVATVKVQLPDNLTNFKIRAKAVSGPDRFGYATGTLAVRLPLIVQPALPRFVRPGDSFAAAAIGRVVEGEGGPGRAQIQAEGVTVQGPTERPITWTPNRPERIAIPVTVEQPVYADDGTLSRRDIMLRVGVERQSDGATDAFEVRLPVRDDQRRVSVRALLDLAPGRPVALPAVHGTARPGTVLRRTLVSDQPALVRMAAGLSFLLEYPYGCTEQRMSLARGRLAMKRFRSLLQAGGGDEDLQRSVQEAMDAIAAAVDPGGLVAYWPGASGYVSLTAWAVEFLAEARDAGYRVDAALLGELTRSLEQALRSDYGRFIDGESRSERTAALRALARIGRFDGAYAAELARQAKFLNLEASAQVLQAFELGGGGTEGVRQALAERLWHGLVLRLHQGHEVYGGLQDLAATRNGLILPSETRTLAEVARALAPVAARERLQPLVDALVTLGRGDGWGSTNANAAALLALSQLLQSPATGAPQQAVEIRGGGGVKQLRVGPDSPVAVLTETAGEPAQAVLAAGAGPVVLRSELGWIPAGRGSQVPAAVAGFVVSRELLQVLPDAPPLAIALQAPGAQVSLAVGDVVEDHVQLASPVDRHYVAVVVPLAAGMEPLNPSLATAPPEARPRGVLTRPPTYAAYLDDRVAFYYDSLPKGSYDFYFRTRATTAGTFVQPAAYAEAMYDATVHGNGNGALVHISAKDQ